MNYKITKGLDRLELDDARILDCDISDSKIVLKVNWAKISDFSEENLPAMVLGNCELHLNNVVESKLLKETEAGMVGIKFPEDFPGDLGEILESESKSDTEISLNGLMTVNDRYCWVNWKIKFETFSFAWEKHVVNDESDDVKFDDEDELPLNLLTSVGT